MCFCVPFESSEAEEIWTLTLPVDVVTIFFFPLDKMFALNIKNQGFLDTDVEKSVFLSYCPVL